MHRKNRFRLASAKRGDVEDRVIRLREAVQREHAQDRGQRRAQNRAFEGDGNERRPAVQRLSSDVQRIRHRRHPELQQVSAQASHDAADQDDQWQLRVVEADGFVQFFDRQRRVRVHAPIAFLRAWRRPRARWDR